MKSTRTRPPDPRKPSPVRDYAAGLDYAASYLERSRRQPAEKNPRPPQLTMSHTTRVEVKGEPAPLYPNYMKVRESRAYGKAREDPKTASRYPGYMKVRESRSYGEEGPEPAGPYPVRASTHYVNTPGIRYADTDTWNTSVGAGNL